MRDTPHTFQRWPEPLRDADEADSCRVCGQPPEDQVHDPRLVVLVQHDARGSLLGQLQAERDRNDALTAQNDQLVVQNLALRDRLAVAEHEREQLRQHRALKVPAVLRRLLDRGVHH